MSRPFIPDVIGDGYVAQTVYPGHCVVPGCTREALVLCDEHRDEAVARTAARTRQEAAEQPVPPTAFEVMAQDLDGGAA